MNKPIRTVRVLFESLRSLENEADREVFLDHACAGDLKLREQLLRMIAMEEQAHRFFETDTRTGGPPEPRQVRRLAAEDVGATIGRYRLAERLGHGGAGVVYLAEQQVPVRRHVALKIIRMGMDTRSVIDRFRMEQRSLSAMDHPNIAQVLDAGSTDSGRPYFVMEWVRGSRITDYCNEKRLSPEQRIDLFIDVCGAIQHAHQKGIIHRDIKPSNVLVSTEGGKATPKVIDFGIAKAIFPEDGENEPITEHGHFVGTPAYMSPEQADRKDADLDTRCDIYSLGVLLYELLTCHLPFDPKELAGAGVIETRRILVERDPKPPSSRLNSLDPETLAEVATNQGTEASKLVSRLRGDLDWIVTKAIEKDRKRRYDTVNWLAMDLRRHLNNEPVSARPPGRVYLARKFVRRNRLIVFSAAGIVASLLLGIGLAYTSYLRERGAKIEQDRLRRIAESAQKHERQLREAAAARENISQAAVLLSEDRIDEADALLHKTPLTSIEPSLEASNVLRSLGWWNAMRGRWKQSAECYKLLIRANSQSSTERILHNADIVAPTAALAANGNRDDLDTFRESTLSRFGGTSNSVAAIQVIQSTITVPADPSLIKQLEPIGDLIADSFRKSSDSGSEAGDNRAWEAWALALLEYRRENYELSITWGNEALESDNIDNRGFAAILHPVLAMSYWRSGHSELARRELELSRELIEDAFSPELPPTHRPFGRTNGFWWDWVLGRTLYHEARDLIGPGVGFD